MTDLRDAARRALMEVAILSELSEANDVTRNELQAMEPGDRLSVGDLGNVLKTKPRKGWRVVDWGAFAKWVETHAPDQIITTTQISPGFIQRLQRDGEYIDGNGEVLTPDGVGITESAPQLRVSPSDAAHEVARMLLSNAAALGAERPSLLELLASREGEQ